MRWAFFAVTSRVRRYGFVPYCCWIVGVAVVCTVSVLLTAGVPTEPLALVTAGVAVGAAGLAVVGEWLGLSGPESEAGGAGEG